jgi:hypothetical protein
VATNPAEGWCQDPFGVQEHRWMSQGRPAKLVRDGGTESYDFHALPDAQHPFLDLAQLMPVHVLEQDGLADPQRLAVELERPLATIVLDHIVIADGDHALAHLGPRPAAAFAAFAALLPSPCRASPSPFLPVSRFRQTPSTASSRPDLTAFTNAS